MARRRLTVAELVMRAIETAKADGSADPTRDVRMVLDGITLVEAREAQGGSGE